MSIVIPRTLEPEYLLKSHTSRAARIRFFKDCWECVKSKYNPTKYSRGHRRKKLLTPVKRFDYWKSEVSGSWLSSLELARLVKDFDDHQVDSARYVISANAERGIGGPLYSLFTERYGNE